MSGGSKPKTPDPVPPPQVSVQAPEITQRTARKRRRGYSSTILAGSLNNRNSVLRTDTLG
jgi:hypothetical protein